MARLHRFLLENQCYHVVTSTRNRIPLLKDPANAKIVVRALQFQRPDRVYLLAYAVMPDHFHAALVPKSPWNISQVMQSVKGYAARVINARSEVRGSFWQRSFYDRMIRDERQLFEMIEYIHMNPVAVGLVMNAEAYEFSSAGRPLTVDLEAFYGNEPRLESLGYGSTLVDRTVSLWRPSSGSAEARKPRLRDRGEKL